MRNRSWRRHQREKFIKKNIRELISKCWYDYKYKIKAQLNDDCSICNLRIICITKSSPIDCAKLDIYLMRQIYSGIYCHCGLCERDKAEREKGTSKLSYYIIREELEDYEINKDIREKITITYPKKYKRFRNRYCF